MIVLSSSEACFRTDFESKILILQTRFPGSLVDRAYITFAMANVILKVIIRFMTS